MSKLRRPLARAKARALNPQRRAPWAALLMAAAALLLLGQAVQVTLRKSGQRLQAGASAHLAKGDADGQVQTTLAIGRDAAGRFYHLDADAGQWRLQRFGSDLVWQATRKGKAGPGHSPVGMSVAPDASVTLGFEDGQLLRFGPALDRPTSRLGLPALQRYAGDGRGGAWCLGIDGALRHEDPQGRELPLGAALAGSRTKAQGLAADEDGALAILYALGKTAQRVRLYKPDGTLDKAFRVAVAPAPAHGVALAGGFVLLNENKLGRGLTLYSRQGRYVGQLTHFSARDLIDFQGFVGGDAGGFAWVGHPQGLTRFSTSGWRP